MFSAPWLEQLETTNCATGAKIRVRKHETPRNPWKFPGNFRETSAKPLEVSRKLPRNFRITRGNFHGTSAKLPRETWKLPLNFRMTRGNFHQTYSSNSVVVQQ